MEQLAKLRDDVDREHLEEVLRSAGYGIYKQRLLGVIVAEMDKLCTDLDPAQTAKKRGLIEGLKLAVTLPEAMLSEYKAKGQ